ncbi:MAG: ABC transporter substrate-binding protein [Cellulosilyticaceae bacterium]
MKKSQFLKVALLAMIASVSTLVGCSSNSTAQSTTPPSMDPSTTVQGEPIKGGLVRTTISSEPDHLDPYLSAASDTEAIMLNVFEGLMGFNEKGELIPRLAQSYSISDDGLNYSFVLRTDVTFHNGKPMTMDDVIYSYKTLSGLGGNAPLSSKFKAVTAITQPDDHTITFTLSEPQASFLSACTEVVVPNDYTEHATKPIGTGPFVFDQYVPGQKIVLQANPNYYDTAHKPFIDTIEFRIMTDPSSILMALSSGELDMGQIDYLNAPTFEGKMQILSNPQNMVQLLALNHTVKPYDDVRVRQAINHAIDKDLLVNGVASGYGTKLYTNMSPASGVWTLDLSSQDPYPYNPEAAKTLLADAGYPNGFDMTIKVPSNYPHHINTAQVMLEQLKAVGINASIELIEWGQWLDSVYSGGQYEATLVGLSGKLEPFDLFVRFTSTYAKNFYHYNNPAYDSLLEEANTTIDEKERITRYHEAQKMLTDDAAAVFVMDPHILYAAKPELQGYTAYPVPFFDASKLYYVGK